MRRNNSHPVDEFILAKLSGRKEEIPFNKDNWNALADRLNNSAGSTATPKADKNSSYFNSTNFTSKLFFVAFVLISSSLFYLSSRMGQEGKFKDSSISATSTFEPMSRQESESKIIWPSRESNKSESKQDILTKEQKERIQPGPSPEMESIAIKPLSPLPLVHQILEAEATKLPLAIEQKIIGESLELLELIDETDQIIIEKDSLFIFW